MKKLLALLLALALMLSLVACGNSADDDVQDNDNPNLSDNNAPDSNPDVDTDDEDENPLTSAVDAINRVWDAYPEDIKPMTFGGETESEDFVENAAANHPIGDGSKLDADFGYPADMIDKISEAAAMRHMMNVNSFTCGAYALNNSADAQAVCDGIEYALMHRSYMCGAPQQLVVMVVKDSFVINVFGAEDLVSAFKDTALSVYGNKISVVYDESMEDAHGDNGINMGDIGIGF